MRKMLLQIRYRSYDIGIPPLCAASLRNRPGIRMVGKNQINRVFHLPHSKSAAKWRWTMFDLRVSRVDLQTLWFLCSSEQIRKEGVSNMSGYQRGTTTGI